MHDLWNQIVNQPLALILASVVGGMLGTIFYGGLWWTVRKCVSSAQPAFWVFGSLVLRMGLALTGFYFVAGGGWQRLIACLLGFFVARLIVTRLTRPPGEIQAFPTQESRHAP